MGIEKLKDNLEKLISKKDITQDEVELMFVRIRLIIEKSKLKYKYPQLNFYCDWIVHSEINRPTKVIDLLLQLNHKIAIDHDKKKELNIHELIAPDECWRELNIFFKETYKSVSYSLDATNWNVMFYSICQILSNRPLRLPDVFPKNYTQKVNQIKNFKTPNNNLIGITSIEFEISEGNDYTPKGAIIWIAKARDEKLIIKGQL